MDNRSARRSPWVPASPITAPRPNPSQDERPALLTLDRAVLGQRCIVAAVAAPPGEPDWARMLEEIGFVPGEHVVLIARAALGGDPLVVRVGLSTFALRRAEAACVGLTASA